MIVRQTSNHLNFSSKDEEDSQSISINAEEKLEVFTTNDELQKILSASSEYGLNRQNESEERDEECFSRGYQFSSKARNDESCDLERQLQRQLTLKIFKVFNPDEDCNNFENNFESLRSSEHYSLEDLIRRDVNLENQPFRLVTSESEQ